MRKQISAAPCGHRLRCRYQNSGGYGGDMSEDQAYDLLDDIDFYYNKVKCRKIEKLMPVLSKLVIEEQKYL